MKDLAKKLARKAFGWLVKEIKEEVHEEIDKRLGTGAAPGAPIPGEAGRTLPPKPGWP